MLPTLYKLCFNRICQLLKNSFWISKLSVRQNPFSLLPPSKIHELIANVIRITGCDPLLSSDLQPLLTSGRVKNFIFTEENQKWTRRWARKINVDAENFQKILEDLTISCHDLVSIDIDAIPKEKNYRYVFSTDESPKVDTSKITSALNCLLSKAHNVKCVKSCIEFDLHVLCNFFLLEKLILHFPLNNHLHDFLVIDGQLRPHTGLKHLEVLDDDENEVSYLDIANILKYCTELTHFNYDIAKSLRYLHGEELFNASLNHTYKLQHCRLGTAGVFETFASKEEVLIASLTCPYLEDVELYINDTDVIAALRSCKTLHALKVAFPLSYPKPDILDNYRFGLQSLLQKPEIGYNLKSLVLSNFKDVDLSLIGMSCPNLETLKVEFIKDHTHSECKHATFQNLKVLELCSLFSNNCEDNTVIETLSNAISLVDLSLFGIGITDNVIRNILERNKLPKLKKFMLVTVILH